MPAAEASPNLVTSVVRLNLLAPFFVAQAANAVMQAQGGGLIINIGSVSAMRPAPGTAAYAAAKAGLAVLTQALAIEWAPAVRVNCVTAGLVRTDENSHHYGDEDALAAVAATVPLGRMATPDDVADACLLLDLAAGRVHDRRQRRGRRRRPAPLVHRGLEARLPRLSGGVKGLWKTHRCPQDRISPSVRRRRGSILSRMWKETAAAQAGILSRRQAWAAGVSKEMIRARLASGRWQRVHAGVVATFSGRLPRESHLWAALLACGPGAVLSHETAAELAGLIATPDPAVHVSVPLTRRVTPRPGITVHRSLYAARARHPALRPQRTRTEHTVVDLIQASTDLDAAVSWLVRAVSARLTTPSRLLAALDTRFRVRWRRELTDALADVAEGCHSMLELRYLRRVERAHGLPDGTRQHSRNRWYDDVAYSDFGVHVELDGRAAHPAEQAFRDHRRDNAAVLTGSRVLRYGFSDVTQRPCLVAAEVATMLRVAGWRGRPKGCAPTCPLNQSGRLVLP